MTNENCRHCDTPITWSEAQGRRWVHTDGGRSRSCRGAAGSIAGAAEDIPAWWLANPAASG